MMRRSHGGALASILAAALAACSGGSSDVLAVGETDRPGVVLELSSCNAAYDVEVRLMASPAVLRRYSEEPEGAIQRVRP